MSADHGERSVSRTSKNLIIATGALLVAVITVIGVMQLRSDGDTAGPATGDAPPPQLTAADVANEFLNNFTAGQATAAGRLTDNPDAATVQLDQVRRTLAPTSVTADRAALVVPAPDATTADEPFTLTWQLGTNRTWQYQSSLHMVKSDAGWRVQWQPALVHPRLGPGQTLVMREGVGQPAVVDRDGRPLLTWTADGTAPTDPTLAPRLTGAMGRVAQGQGGTSGWYVALADGAGAELEVVHGTPTKPVAATLSVPVQQAAQAAVNTQQYATVLVAIQPSTGDILAVAQNAVTGSEPVALNGLFAPGSTFKIATAAALIEGDVADTGTVLPCPGSTLIGQRTIDNADGFALGDVPLRTAFAKSCNTTFATQAATLQPAALGDAADQFGLGADFDIPGIKTETGSVPDPANNAEQVENSIGQGRVQVSCFGLALMTGTVATGRAVTPRLWRDLPTTVNAGYQAPPSGVINSLRVMMRDVVTSGTGAALAGYGKVYGKTGTAEVEGAADNGWFAGYRDDIAFATLVQEGGSSSAALDVTGRFLGALG